MALKDLLYDLTGETVKRQRISQSRGPTLRFTGQMIGGYSTRDVNRDRWEEAEVFSTEGGALVVVIIGASIVEGEKELVAATVIEPGDVTEMRIAAMDALSWKAPARELAKSLGWTKLEREIA